MVIMVEQSPPITRKEPTMAHLNNGGIQAHSAGSDYPYTIVIHGGWPTPSNDCTAEVLGYLNGEQVSFGHLDTHREAERLIRELKVVDRGGK
jgi:hypothetical protein